MDSLHPLLYPAATQYPMMDPLVTGLSIGTLLAFAAGVILLGGALWQWGRGRRAAPFGSTSALMFGLSLVLLFLTTKIM